LSFEPESAFEIALALDKKNSADFHITLLHVAGESSLRSFDRTASTIDGA
jgi:hypothetical protein